MLLLLFQLGENLYAIDTAEVVEIVPIMQIAKVPAAPTHIAGVFNYHSRIVPVIDLSLLIQGTPCRPCYSTRVILVNAASNPMSTSRPLGLMAERVTETLKTKANSLEDAEQVSTAPYLGKLFIGEKGIVQQIHWQQLISEADQAILFASEEDQKNGTGRN